MNHIVNIFVVTTPSLASAFSVVHAEEQKVAKTDAAHGETIFDNGIPANGMPACASCHDAGGSNAMNVDPKLAGQHAGYVEEQSKDFKAKTDRNHPVMSSYANALSGQGVEDIGAYLGKQPAWKPGSTKSRDTVKLGQKLYRGGDTKCGIAACAGCHGPASASVPAQCPRIAGQFSEYAEVRLVAFQSDARKNSIQIHDLAGRVTTQQIKAVADYVAGLR